MATPAVDEDAPTAAAWCNWCGTLTVSSHAPPDWIYPLKVRAVEVVESGRDTFVDRRSIVYVFRGKHAGDGGVDGPLVRRVPLCKEALYLRTPAGLYRKVGGPSAIEQLAARLPPTFAEAVAGGILINLAVLPAAWDADPAAHVWRIAYRLRPLAGMAVTDLDWVPISRRCLREIRPKFA